jgi:hypothetical protein
LENNKLIISYLTVEFKEVGRAILLGGWLKTLVVD